MYAQTNYHQQQIGMQMAMNPMMANMMPAGLVNGVFMFTGQSNTLPGRI